MSDAEIPAPAALQDCSWMDRIQSEIIAIKSIEWLASEEYELRGFLRITGMSIENLRSQFSDPDVLASALDHVLSSEKRLLEFCEAARIAPGAPLQARRFLPGGNAPEWT